MISADHPRFSCTSDMSLTIYGKIFSGPLVHTNDPSGTVLIARSLKFQMKVEEGLYYPCSENKGADQLRSYCEADLRLCFRLCRLLVFS